MNYKKIGVTFLLAFSLVSSAFAAELKTIDRVAPEYKERASSWMFPYVNEEAVNKANASYKKPEFPNIKPQVVYADNVELSIYRPKEENLKKLPVVYYSHGGGYLMRMALNSKGKYQNIADSLKAAVVTPKYRTSMEAPFPAALVDAYKGLQYITALSDDLNLDCNNIVLMGDSAGGGLSAALALYNRDKDNIKLKGQVLIYPMLDSRTGSKEDIYKSPYTGEICWNRTTNVFAWKKLRGNKKIAKDMLPYFSPSFATNLKNLPETLIYVGDMDLFVNEDIAYANKLIQNGVVTEMHVVPGLYHAFDGAMPKAKATQDFWQIVYRSTEKMFKK